MTGRNKLTNIFAHAHEDPAAKELALEAMTREQMLAEFGAPGVENANVLDLVTLDAATDCVHLVMLEQRGWGSSSQQLRQLEEKINRYLGYVLDGFLVQHYPQYAHKSVQIRLDCVEAPTGEAVPFLKAAQGAIESHGLEFVVRIAPTSPA